MILTKLRLENFKRFKESTSFDLWIDNINNNIILIEALNWVWKTSFLQAIKGAFFWLESSEFKKYLSYEAKDENDFSISIELEYKDNNFQNCKIIRKYEASSYESVPKEKLSLYINDDLKNFTLEEWNDYINKTFPKEISTFFFFDWEKIQYLINPNDPKKIKSAIEKVLWIEVIRNLKDDLSDLKNEVFKKINNDWVDRKIQIKKMQLEDYESKKIRLRDDIIIIENKIRKEEQKKKDIKDKIEILAKSWLTKGKLDERNLKEIKLEQFTKEIALIDENIEIFKNNYLDTFLLTWFFDPLKDKIKEENILKDNKWSWNIDDEKINRIIQELFIPKCIVWWENFDISKTDLIKWKIKTALSWNLLVNNFELILDLNNKDEININIAIDNINKSNNIDLLNLIEKKEFLLDNINLLKKEIKDINRQTGNNENWEYDINILFSDEENIETELQKLNTEFSIKAKDLEIIDNEIKKVQKEMEMYLSQVSLIDSDKKYFDLLSKLSEVFETYIDQLVEKRKDELESKTFEMFQLLSSQRIYNKIEINEDYEIKLLDINWVHQTNLSAWQTQILMTSLLWWLEKLSDFQLPIIIDTPLARLDPIHRNNMLEKYFHNAWWQVIILSQPSEITKEDKNNQLFSKYLKNNSYISMTFDEDKMQSVISIKPIS